MPIWFRRDGGNWNNDVSANPATGVGGISLAGIRGQTMYICGQGADANIAVNFGQSAFTYAVPSGFTAGWPAVGGGWSSFDPAKNSGPVTLSNSNRTFNLNSFNGMVQSVDGYSSGAFYYEYTNTFNTFFTFGAGTGVSRVFPGLDPNFWDSGAQYNIGNPHGGVGLFNGSLGSGFHASISNQGVAVIPDFGVVGSGTKIAVAVRLEPIVMGMTDLQLFQPIPTDSNRDVTLRYSDDAGASWSQPIIQTTGDTGEYETQVQWRRLGIARNRVFELSWSNEFATALTSVFANTTKSET